MRSTGRTQAALPSGLTRKVENLAAISRAMLGGDGEMTSCMEIGRPLATTVQSGHLVGPCNPTAAVYARSVQPH